MKQSDVKRYNNLFDQVTSLENLRLAEKNARKGKANHPGVRLFDKDPEGNLERLREALINGTFQTSPYQIFKIREPKERIISKLPYYPDHIVHHAIIQVVGPLWEKTFTADTFCCIKGRGIHACAQKVQKALKADPEGTRYCLKLDIRHFYPEMAHAIMKREIRRKIKDRRLLALLDSIIDSTDLPPQIIANKNGKPEAQTTPGKGIPIGNYLSPFFANIYLSGFDHWIKEIKRVKYYFRYADDIVILSSDKAFLHALLRDIQEYMAGLQLEVKRNWQVFPVDARGIDFLGYVFFHGYTLMRKGIKQNLCRRLAKLRKRRDLSEKAFKLATSSWWGWAKYCDSRHLLHKLNIFQAYANKQQRAAA